MNTPDAIRPLSATERTTVGRKSDRARTDRLDLYAVLDAGLICHLGVIVDGYPVVLPTGYGRIGDTLYLHGSSGNRSLRAADGRDVCVTVTHLDGLVCARSIFHHSLNYRSAVIIGAPHVVTDEDEQLVALQAVSDQLAPGQWDAVRKPTKKELAATAVLALPLDEASVKARSGPPSDDDEDYDLDVWAGVIPAALTFGPPRPDPLLRTDIEIPDHILALSKRTLTAL